MTTTDLDLITLGRVGVDLHPEQIATPLAEVTRFTRSLGGSPTNVAVGAARLGLRSAVITKVGHDAFGTYVRNALKLGPDDVLARAAGELFVVPPHPVEVVSGLGAGDAFGAALCHGLLTGRNLESTLRRANVAGAIVASRLACADTMPTREETERSTGDGDAEIVVTSARGEP